VAAAGLVAPGSRAAAATEASDSPSVSVPLPRVASRARGFAPVVPGYRMRFPFDEGSHPDFRTEWWYVTGWLARERRAAVGFQVTFFRTRLAVDEKNPSAFAARDVIIAHAALSDPGRGRLLHDQRAARAAFGLAGAEVGRTRTWIDDWSLIQNPSGYVARIAAADFTLALTFTPTQPPLLQGEDGVSRKGPRPESASYYYSIPQLRVSGSIHEARRAATVTGSAWLDHEWSSSYMDERAVGWDWVGLNLDDGAALTAFRMREPKGGALWAGGAFRSASGARTSFGPRDIDLAPLREWQSARTGVRYPVAWRLRAAGLELTLEPLMDDQESDSRASVGAIYWEGAVRAVADRKVVGRGYLELTGYHRAMRL
jgi:predicted secreted hydrolase